VEQVTRFEPILNLKTAKTMELTIPAAFLATADEVIYQANIIDDRRIRRMAISGQEFYAVGIAAPPNDLTWLALRMSRHKLQSERVADIDCRIGHDFGAAWSHVQHEALALRHSVVDRNPGRLFVQFPSRFARHLCPWLISHDDYPSLDLNAISSAIVKIAHQIDRDFVKFLLRYCLEILLIYPNQFVIPRRANCTSWMRHMAQARK